VHELVADTARRGPWQTHAALVLGERGEGAGIVSLTGALDACGADVALCKRVLEVLGALRSPAALGPLLSHLPFVQTRRETVDALGALGDPAAVGPLLGCLESDPYVSVRVAAAHALGRIGGARAVQGLRGAIGREPEEAVKSAVREALAGLGRRR
jgi:HEAT repeat protein